MGTNEGDTVGVGVGLDDGCVGERDGLPFVGLLDGLFVVGVEPLLRRLRLRPLLASLLFIRFCGGADVVFSPDHHDEDKTGASWYTERWDETG